MENRISRTLGITAAAALTLGAAMQVAPRADPAPKRFVKQGNGRRHGSTALDGSSWRQFKRAVNCHQVTPCQPSQDMMAAHDWYARPKAARS